MRAEVMAHHLTEAGQADASVEYWARAGRLAVSRAASREAVAHFQRAIAQLLSLPDTAERNRREASLQDALGGALAHVTGVASEALVPVYARARDLCQQTGDTSPSSSPNGTSGMFMLPDPNIGMLKRWASG